MIITQKEFPNYKRYEMDYCGRPLFMEVGKMAELCNASVMVGYGDTRVLVTCTASARPRDGIDYFPLSVDFNEKLYAVGRIPGAYLRREGRPSLQVQRADAHGVLLPHEGVEDLQRVAGAAPFVKVFIGQSAVVLVPVHAGGIVVDHMNDPGRFGLLFGGGSRGGEPDHRQDHQSGQ